MRLISLHLTCHTGLGVLSRNESSAGCGSRLQTASYADSDVKQAGWQRGLIELEKLIRTHPR
jgi:hypothetical protein